MSCRRGRATCDSTVQSTDWKASSARATRPLPHPRPGSGATAGRGGDAGRADQDFAALARTRLRPGCAVRVHGRRAAQHGRLPTPREPLMIRVSGGGEQDRRVREDEQVRSREGACRAVQSRRARCTIRFMRRLPKRSARSGCRSCARMFLRRRPAHHSCVSSGARPAIFCLVTPVPSAPGTVAILRSPRSKRGLSPSLPATLALRRLLTPASASIGCGDS